METTEIKQKMPKVDAYVCPNLHIAVSTMLDGHEGKPPASIRCSICKERAVSLGFQVNQSLKPVFEWYKPNEQETEAQLLKLGSPEQKERLKKSLSEGLLLARPITNPESPKA